MNTPLPVDWGNISEEEKLLKILTGHIYKYFHLDSWTNGPTQISTIPKEMECCCVLCNST